MPYYNYGPYTNVAARAKRCTDYNPPRHYFAGIGDREPVGGHARYIQSCAYCGELRSLGPSDESKVAVEVEAARRAAEWISLGNVPTGYDRFDWCPDMRGDRLCERCEALYLARCIVAHEEEKP